MNDFKGRHFRGEVILGAVRWYCRYGISYRDLETMLAERGVGVDHSTIYRWVQRYAPEMEKRLRWYWKRPCFSRSWCVDETYIKVKGQWTYLYRAVDKDGDTIDFYLPLTHPERQSCQTFFRQGHKRSEGVGEARDNQYGQSTDLWHSDQRAQEGW
ncbi:IS6 family transposase [Acetobacter thailandicus]|uniref:IS6 family transposase n=1 Tax=Acetobacter thailandicus TaxID=1502842 RepID=UPI0038D11209